MSTLRNGALTGETGNWRVGTHSRCSVCVNLTHKPSQTGRHTPKRSSPPGWAGPGLAWRSREWAGRSPCGPAAGSSGSTVAGPGHPSWVTSLYTITREVGKGFSQSRWRSSSSPLPASFHLGRDRTGSCVRPREVPENLAGDELPRQSAQYWGAWQSQGSIWPLHSLVQWLSTFNLLEATQSPRVASSSSF